MISTAPKPDSAGGLKSYPVGVIVALLTVYIIWGSTYLGMRFAIEGIPPFTMAGFRFLIAGAIVFIFLKLRGAPTPSFRQWGGGALVGFLLLGIGNGGVVFAEQWVASGLAALGIATVPLWVAVFGRFLGLRQTPREWLGIALGFAGIIVLNVESSLRASPLGAIALVLSSVSWAVGSLWSRRLPMPEGAMASAVQMLGGGASLLCMSVIHHERIPHHHLAIRPELAFIYLIFGAIAGFSAYVYLLSHTRPALATSYAYVNPVIAVILGSLVASEPITVAAVIALVLVVGGVVLVAIPKSAPS